MIISTKNLEFTIGSQTILNGISLNFTAGSMTGIIGPNGSGKTTFFNCLSGFSYPSKGTISFREQDVSYTSPHLRARMGLGRVFQNFGIFREQTVLENVLIALEKENSLLQSFIPSPNRLRAQKESALEYLKEVGLQDKAQQKAGSLSGGQMRLLEIIRTLAFKAEVFLLDEPTAGVSPRMKEDIISLIQKLKGFGKTVIIIEHDMNFIQSFVERIVVLNVGCVFMDGTPTEVLQNEGLKELYFGKNI